MSKYVRQRTRNVSILTLVTTLVAIGLDHFFPGVIGDAVGNLFQL